MVDYAPFKHRQNLGVLLPFRLTSLGDSAPFQPSNASGTEHPAKTIAPGETLEASRVEVPKSIENRH